MRRARGAPTLRWTDCTSTRAPAKALPDPAPGRPVLLHRRGARTGTTTTLSRALALPLHQPTALFHCLFQLVPSRRVKARPHECIPLVEAVASDSVFGHPETAMDCAVLQCYSGLLVNISCYFVFAVFKLISTIFFYFYSFRGKVDL